MIYSRLEQVCYFMWFRVVFPVVVQSLSCVWLFVIPWTAACQASLSPTISWSLLKLVSIESVILSNHFNLCHPLLLPSSLSQGLFQWVSHQVAKVLELQLQCQSFQWIFMTGLLLDWLVCFKIDWFDFLAVQRTLMSLLQYHSSKASIPGHSAFFIAQLSHP